MRASRAWQRVLLLLSFASFLVFLSMAPPPAARAQQVAAWTSIANYPPTVPYTGFPSNGSLGIASTSCVTSEGYLYCIGGKDGSGTTNATVYADIADLGIKPWSAGPDYPLLINSEACVSSDGYVYCVGGEGAYGPGNDTSSTYFASLSSSGIGPWKSTTRYPVAAEHLSCVASSGYLYCLGGTATGAAPEPAYFASLSGSGVGSWQATTQYPGAVEDQACVAASSTVYCVGGRVVGGTPTNATAFATLSTSGIGQWQTGPGYPFDVAHQSCVALSGYDYCVAGQRDAAGAPGVTYTSANSSVYFAAVSTSQIGQWQATTRFPELAYDQSCVASTYIYCVGGMVNNTGAISGGVYTSGPPPVITVTTTPGLLTSTTTTLVTTTSQSLIIYSNGTTTSVRTGSFETVTDYGIYGVLVLIPVFFILLIVTAVRRRRSRGERSSSAGPLAVLLLFLIVFSAIAGVYFLLPERVQITGIAVSESYWQGTLIFNPVTPTYFDRSPAAYPGTPTTDSSNPIQVEVTVVNNDTGPHYFSVGSGDVFYVDTLACAGCVSTAGNATLADEGFYYGVPPESSATITLQVQLCSSGSVDAFDRCFKHYTGPLDLVITSPA
ncbi:MAG: hypothetical protein ABSF83_08265 [Nitrososphaerales archaeon]